MKNLPEKDVMIFDFMTTVKIYDREKLMKKSVRYIGTDYNEALDIYEDKITGDYIACYEY